MTLCRGTGGADDTDGGTDEWVDPDGGTDAGDDAEGRTDECDDTDGGTDEDVPCTEGESNPAASGTGGGSEPTCRPSSSDRS
jgi:hypothetical protein